MYATRRSRRPVSPGELIAEEVFECLESRQAARMLRRVCQGEIAPQWRRGFAVTPSSDHAHRTDTPSTQPTHVVFLKEYRI